MRKFFSCLFLLAVSATSFGQLITLQAGPTSSNVSWSSFSANTKYVSKSITGIQFFVGARYLEKKYIDVSTNIGFIQKGGTLGYIMFDSSYAEGFDISYQKARLNYLSLNTTINLKYPVSKSLSPFISVGPRADYLLSYSSPFDNYSSSPKKLSFGMLIGTGIRYKPSRIELGLRADYLYNFTKVIRQPKLSADSPGQMNDKTFLFSFTAAFPLK